MRLPSPHAVLGLCSAALLGVVGVRAEEEYEPIARVPARARALLHDPSHHGVGVLSTIYPDDYADEALRGAVCSGAEYFAPCGPEGDLVFIALTISQNWRNVLYSASHNATFSITPDSSFSSPDARHTAPGSHDWNPARPAWRRGMPSKPRMTLYGDVHELAHGSPEALEAARCFLHLHPDAKHWAEGSRDSPHEARWVRLRAQKVYRVGGFGDESRIGWIDIDAFRKADPRDAGLGPGSDEPRHRAPAALFAENMPAPASLLFQ